MGLENSKSQTFLSIGEGKITRRMLAPTPNSKERTLKNGKLVHEEHYDRITGLITGIETRTHDQYGKSWVVTIVDGEDEFKLQMDYSSGYSSAFLKALPNADLSVPMTLIPKMTIEGQKKKTSMFISQHGQALKWFYTKDNPQGLPPMVQVKVKGVMQWDDTDMMEFLENMVTTKIIPNLPKVGAATAAAQPAMAPQTADAFAEDEEDFAMAAATPTPDKKMPF